MAGYPYALTVNVTDGQQLRKSDGQELFTVPAILAVGGLVPLPADLVGVQIIDPRNVTGVATDTGAKSATVPGYDNAGYTGRVWTSYQALTIAWGAYRIVIDLPLTLVWASTGIGSTDPVVLEVTPLNRLATWAVIGNLPTVVSTSTPLNVTPKNRAAGRNTMLLADLSTAHSAGLRLQNATGGKASTSWTYGALTGEDQWPLFQPLAAQTLATLNTFPAEVNAWAAGDTIHVVQATQIHIVALRTIAPDNFEAIGVAYGFDVFAAAAVGVAQFTGMICVEVLMRRETLLDGQTGLLGAVATNCYFSTFVQAIGFTQLIGGGTDADAGSLNLDTSGAVGLGATIDGDFVLGGPAGAFVVADEHLGIGFMCLDVVGSGASPADGGLVLDSGVVLVEPIFYAGCGIYSGMQNTETTNINVSGTARLAWDDTTTAAGCFTFPLAILGGLLLNRQQGEAAYITTSVGVGTVHTNVSTQVDSIDAIASDGHGGISSLAAAAGGASVVPTSLI